MQTISPSPLVPRLTKHLPTVEMAVIAAVAIGAVLMWLEMDKSVLRVSMYVLAAVHFLMGYRPIDVQRKEGELLGFTDLLGIIIIPKVLWISCSICCVGLAFYFDMGLKGYKEMLMIGGTCIGFFTFMLAILLMTGVKHINVVTPILLRAIPLGAAALYIVFG